MKTTKLGAMFLISILALAGVGMGYAAWTDTITITGQINTGSVEWKFIDVSGTWVWKVYDYQTDEIYITDDPLWVPSDIGYDGELIAYSEAVLTDDHNAVVTYDNLFPCIYFEADVVVEYTGTVPGKINSIIPLNNLGVIDSYTTITVTYTPVGGLPIPVIDPMGLQLHEGDQIHAVMTIHLPQDDTLMGITGSFSVEVGIIQWNEYGQ